MKTMYRPTLAILSLRLVLLVGLLSSIGCHDISVALGRYPTHPQAEAAVARLLSSDPTLVTEAKSEIAILGEGAMPVLYGAMDSANGVGRDRIMESATQIAAPPELLVGIIDKGAHDESPNVRQNAAFHAGRFPQLSERLAPTLRGLAKDSSPQVRAAALSSLGSYPASAQLPVEDLITLMRDPHIVVAAGATSLAIKRPEQQLQSAAREALPSLLQKLRDPSPANRAAVLFAIGQYGTLAESSVPALKNIAEREKVPEVRLQAAITLVKINTPRARKTAAPILREFARSTDPKLRVAAESALSMISSGTRR